MNTHIHAAAGPARIRRLNRVAVLRRLRLAGPQSRSDLAMALGLSPAGMSAVVNELLDAGLIRPASGRSDGPRARRGRPMAPLELNPDAAYALGLRLLPTARALSIQLAWIDYAGGIHPVAARLTPAPDSVEALLGAIAAGMEMLAQATPDPNRVLGSAIAVPGVVADGRVRLAPSLAVLEHEQFGPRLLEVSPYPAMLQNDVNLSVLSELNEQARLREKNFVYLYIGAGVGAGIGLQGRLWSASGWAGEVGHIRVDRAGAGDASFEELLAPDRALAGAMARIGLAAGDLDGLAAAVKGGRRDAHELLTRYTATLAELVHILNAVLDLDEVIVDFPSAALFDCIQPELERRIVRQHRPVAISLPARGGAAAVRGAALAALESVTERVESN